MLVLTRKVNQTIHLGNNIVIKVVGITKEHVRLGFDAPDEVKILRGEILGRISKDQVLTES